eukprot:COSAG01_NODE_4127_length_5326_cov_3.238569_3_plen_108_part_00
MHRRHRVGCLLTTAAPSAGAAAGLLCVAARNRCDIHASPPQRHHEGGCVSRFPHGGGGHCLRVIPLSVATGRTRKLSKQEKKQGVPRTVTMEVVFEPPFAAVGDTSW